MNIHPDALFLLSLLPILDELQKHHPAPDLLAKPHVLYAIDMLNANSTAAQLDALTEYVNSIKAAASAVFQNSLTNA